MFLFSKQIAVRYNFHVATASLNRGVDKTKLQTSVLNLIL